MFYKSLHLIHLDLITLIFFYLYWIHPIFTKQITVKYSQTPTKSQIFLCPDTFLILILNFLHIYMFMTDNSTVNVVGMRFVGKYKSLIYKSQQLLPSIKSNAGDTK
jgi:hypothetical protein